MSGAGSWPLIGYSVYDISEECYEYNENACYIAATPDSAQQFLEVASLVPGNARVEAVHWDDLLCPSGKPA